MKKKKGPRLPKKSMDFYRGLFIGITSIILIAFFSILLVKTFTKKQVALHKPAKSSRPMRQKSQGRQSQQILEKQQGTSISKVSAPPIPSRKPTQQKTRGKIAIIIDDNGYGRDACRHIYSIDQPIAIAILPSLPYSKIVAACAHARNKEILLHLPLEPKEYTETYAAGYIITTTMSPQVIKSKLTDAINSIPHVVGLNNHMGSKATENAPTMKVIFSVLRERDLFFVDSRVTTKSVSKGLALKMGIPCSERDVFLDNKSDRNYIENQFRELSQVAAKQGHAIGIGHDRSLTWKILKEQLSFLENNGFKIVPLKEILTF